MVLLLLIAYNLLHFLTIANSAEDAETNLICSTATSGNKGPIYYLADPTNCHFYYECAFANSSVTLGYRRQCQRDQRWHQVISQCAPEDPERPCGDPCQSNPTLQCYNSTCQSLYYVCSNLVTYQMCCPLGTGFNERTCSCDLHVDLNASSCGEGNVCFKKRNRQFQHFANNNADKGRCLLYLPFDDDLHDRSFNKFRTVPKGHGDIEHREEALIARGYGSLALFSNNSQSGHLEIPDLKSSTPHSWCLFFRCSLDSDCNVGTLMSNKFASLKIQLGQNGEIMAKIRLIGVGFVTLTGKLSTPLNDLDNFTQICLIYDDENGKLSLYINSQLASSTVIASNRRHSIMATGGLYLIGGNSFAGFVDEVLICPHAMSLEEIAAHFQGGEAMQNASLVPRVYSAISSGAPVPTLEPQSLNMSAIKLGVYGGSPMAPNELPWTAQIVVQFQSGFVQTCAGSLISDSWVLTTASCVTDKSNFRLLWVKDIAIYLGQYDLKKPGSGAMKRKWKWLIRHSSYDTMINYDFALISLEEPIRPFTNSIRPISLPDYDLCFKFTAFASDNASNSTDGCESGTVAAWGFTENGPTNIPVKTTLWLKSRSDCANAWSGAPISDAHICAGDGDPATICMGDSGAGLACQTTFLYNNDFNYISPDRNRTAAIPSFSYYIIGVASWVAADSQGRCNIKGYPNIFGRVCKVLPWITDVMNRYSII